MLHWPLSTCSIYLLSELDLSISSVIYYSDSLVVLGYLRNKTKRFSRYVTARVGGILSSSSIDQWKYIQTDKNPADIATREHTSTQLLNSSWLSGPSFLGLSDDFNCEEYGEDLHLPETIEETSALVSKTSSNHFFEALTKFSNWKKKVGVAAAVIKALNLFKKRIMSSSEVTNMAQSFIISEVQRQGFPDVYSRLKSGKQISGDDRLASLSPWMDKYQVIRVGGRLQQGDFTHEEKHPILLPPRSDVTVSILASCHTNTKHQGRLITTAAVRQSGFHILNPRSVISNFIKSCTVCQRLRGELLSQKMAELPRDRVERTAPFEQTGMDVFGPYFIIDGKSTRRTTASKKVYVLLLTCLFSRAVHLEMLTSMDTPTFIMAFRRFIAIRGNCRLVRCDNGTNFVGAKNQSEDHLDETAIRDDLQSRGCKWEFLPPRASHMAGVWERKVGSVKKVLTASILLLKTRILSRDEFSTLLQEAASIVNNTPLSEVPCDPTEPFPVSPAMLLNMRESPSNCNTEFSEDDLLAYGKKRWRRTQFISDQFWIRWKRQYILDQQTRNKWMYPTRNVSKGDIVLLKDSSSRNNWPMAIVSKVIPSKDSLVRRVILRLHLSSTGKAQYRERAIHDLVMLIPNPSTSSPLGECPGRSQELHHVVSSPPCCT